MAGRPARRRRPPRSARGRHRARARRGALHGRPPASRGCCTRRCCAARTRTRASTKHRPRAARSSAPGVRAASGPTTSTCCTREPGYPRRRRSPRSRPTRSSRRRPRVELIDVEWEVLEPLLDPDEAVAAGSFIDDAAHATSAATSSAASPRPTSSSRPSTARRPSCTTRWRRTSRSASWEGDTLDVYISTQYIWGVRSAIAETARARRRTSVRVVCNYMGGGFGAKNDPGDYTFIAAELAKRTGRPVRCALTRREENVASRQPQRDRSSGCAPARAPTGRSSRSRGDFVNAVGWSRLVRPRPRGRCRCSTRATNVRTVDVRREAQHCRRTRRSARRASSRARSALECLLDELAAQARHRPARAAAPQPRRQRP